eukprot:Selendium_serpulae@DN5694_c0_g1_i2.p1
MPSKSSWLNKWFPQRHPTKEAPSDAIHSDEWWKTIEKTATSPSVSRSLTAPPTVTGRLSALFITKHCVSSDCVENASTLTSIAAPVRSASCPGSLVVEPREEASSANPQTTAPPNHSKSFSSKPSTNKAPGGGSSSGPLGLRLFQSLFRERSSPTTASSSKEPKLSARGTEKKETEGKDIGSCAGSESPRPLSSTTETSIESSQRDMSMQSQSNGGWQWGGRKIFGSLFENREREPSPPQSIVLGRRGQQIEKHNRRKLQRERRKKERAMAMGVVKNGPD